MDKLFTSINFAEARKVLELGGLNPSFSHELGEICKKHGSELHLVTPNPEFHAPDRFFISVPDDSYLLDFPDASFDVIAIRHLLEYLRMDQLYMVFSEAKRLLRPGGELIIANKTFSDTAWKKFWATTILKKRLLRLHHYFSPEDWEERSWFLEPKVLIPREVLLLKKV